MEQETPPNGPPSILNKSFQILCLYTGKARIYDFAIEKFYLKFTFRH